MINKLRVLMLLLAIFVAGYAIHSFLSKFKENSGNIDFRISKEAADVEIKKFKVLKELEIFFFKKFVAHILQVFKKCITNQV